MRIAIWTPKATNTPTYYVILIALPLFTFCGPCIVKYFPNKDQQDALLFLNLFQ